jgi:hypothetical protein
MSKINKWLVSNLKKDDIYLQDGWINKLKIQKGIIQQFILLVS